MKPPGVEVCNGIDNDCDGKVDELDIAVGQDGRRQAGLPRRADQNVTMFAYEASRSTRPRTNYGFDSTRRPCSVAGQACPGPT